VTPPVVITTLSCRHERLGCVDVDEGDGRSVRPVSHAAELAALEQEFLRADILLLELAAVITLKVNRLDEWARLSDQERSVISHATEAARQHTRRWFDYNAKQSTDPARWAVADAVVAPDLRSHMPGMARLLEGPWKTAVRIRQGLRTLGPEAEQVALRLLATWHGDLTDLPMVVEALIHH
jgi:hypothetical protein